MICSPLIPDPLPTSYAPATKQPMGCREFPPGSHHTVPFSFPSNLLVPYLAALSLRFSTWGLCCGPWTLQLQYRLSCSMEYGILIPWSGTESASSALQGRFLAPGPLGKSLSFLKLKHSWFIMFWVYSKLIQLYILYIYVRFFSIIGY